MGGVDLTPDRPMSVRMVRLVNTEQRVDRSPVPFPGREGASPRRPLAGGLDCGFRRNDEAVERE